MSDLPTQILLVDDDKDLCRLLEKFFRLHGCDVTALNSAVDLGSRLEQINPAIVVLDLMMPTVDGLTALIRLREQDRCTPVIMLSARSEDVDRIIGLELGADDYLGKPFKPQELLARINAVLRHRPHAPRNPGESKHSRYAFGRFELIPTSGVLLRDGRPVKIGARERMLLEILASRPLEPLSRETIVHLLDEHQGIANDRSVYVMVLRLRRIIEEDPRRPRFIQTLRDVGYVFVPEQPR